MSEQTNKKQLLSKITTRKNVLVATAVLVFLGSIIYMQLGNSVHSKYEESTNPVALNSPPTPFELPNANNANLTGGFNVSEGFVNLPGFDVPPGLISQFPSSFGNGSFGGIPIINPISGGDPSLGGGSGNPIDIPDINPPSPPGSGIDPPLSGGPDPGNGGGTFQPPDLNPNENEGGYSNSTFNPTSDKARNLPKLDFLNFGGINLDFINIAELLPVNNLGAMSYLFLILAGLFFNGNFIPLFFKRMEEFEESGKAGESIFFVPKRNLEEIKKRKERIRRLMVFKDHVDELVQRSKERIIDQNASTTIIVGYHELDNAFSEFANLIRTKDITPLEHANSHFEEDEISNEVLEKIVELFYLSRYGRRDLEKKYGYLFIELLENLVIANPDFMLHLQEFDEIISD